MKAVLQLRDTPKEGFFKLSFISGDTGGYTYHYPEFYINKFTKIKCKLQKDKYYLVTFTASIDRDLKKRDLKRGKLFLREVEECIVFEKSKDRYLGTSSIQGTITSIKNYSIKAKHKEMDFLETEVKFSRIKLNLGKSETYIWNYQPEIQLEKGDTIKANVDIFCKRAYDENGLVDMSGPNTYKTRDGQVKSKGYTELKIVSAQKINQEENE